MNCKNTAAGKESGELEPIGKAKSTHKTGSLDGGHKFCQNQYFCV